MVFGDKPQPSIIVHQMNTVEGNQPQSMQVVNRPLLPDAPPPYKGSE
jgi:hypothetical protein